MKRNTVCRLCSSCCPVEVEVSDHRLLTARRQFPLPPEQQWPCPKLAAAARIAHAPDRLQRPLLRVGGRRDGAWREADWEEALDWVAERFRHFRSGHGAESVCWLRGMAADWGAPWDYANRLMNAFGSPNTIGNGSVCHVAREMAHTYTYGAMSLPQARDARCILVWGKNDMNTNPPACDAILEGCRQGAKLIVIDPVRTGLAERADLWLQIKPGHDGLLAMAMIHEILANNLHDAAFVRDWTMGLEDLRRTAASFTPEAVAEALWLRAEDIRTAARMYATTAPACIIDGNGLDMQLQVFQDTRAVCLLRALTGNLDRPGGDLLPQPVPTRNLQLRERLPTELAPITSAYPLFNRFHSNWGLHAQSCIPDAILEGRPYPVRMLVVQSGNPAVTMADSGRVREALAKVECLVVIDPFLTRTAAFADVVLPACGCFEKTQLNRAALRHNRVVLQDQILPPLGDSRPDWWIIFELARRLGLEQEFPWTTVEEAIDEQLQPAGITVAALRHAPGGISVAETAFQKYLGQGFATPSGKVELYSSRLAAAGHAGVPYGDGWPADPIGFADQAADLPWIGISGPRSGRFTHSQFHRIPDLLAEEPEGRVDIHPRDAGQQGIADGDLLRISTPRGELRLKARIWDGVPVGALLIGWGWGETDPTGNLNDLTDDHRRNPVTATPSSRTFYCRMEKVLPAPAA